MYTIKILNFQFKSVDVLISIYDSSFQKLNDNTDRKKVF